MTEIEKTLRMKLAAAHHIVHYQGWDDLLAAHLSARIPDTNHLLITPHNTAFEMVCASSLVKTDLDGNIIGEGNVMPQATNIHASIYKNSTTVMSAMHTHSKNAVAVASLECGLRFFHQQSLRFYDDVAYHKFAGLALESEGEEMVESLGNKKILMLKNHGVLTTGKSIEEALYALYYLEESCDIQLRVMSTNTTIIEVSKENAQLTKKQFDKIQSTHLEFETLTRRIEGRSHIDYRN
ncbi:class II aldolase/adducin family protein [Francisellaceae bacterium]|nr:class II aldolase/adducin family protein [Francisellaceae bacterium]